MDYTDILSKTIFLIKRKWCWCCNEQKIKLVIVSALVILSAPYCTRGQNIEWEMSLRLTTPFPGKVQHFCVMMDVFIVWQTTLTADGDYTSYFLLLFNLCSSPTGSKQKQLWEIENSFYRDTAAWNTGCWCERCCSFKTQSPLLTLFTQCNYTIKEPGAQST